jgi:hypothetical protein
MVAAEGVDLIPPNQPTSDAALLEVLATVSAAPDQTLGRVVDLLRRTGVDGVLVAVLGAMEADDVEQLARLRHGAGACVAVLVDTPTWAGSPGTATHAAAATLLRRSGWRVLEIVHGTTLASVWGEAGVRSSRAVELTS